MVLHFLGFCTARRPTVAYELGTIKHCETVLTEAQRV